MLAKDIETKAAKATDGKITEYEDGTTIEVSECSMESPATKGAIITTANISEFILNGYFGSDIASADFASDSDKSKANGLFLSEGLSYAGQPVFASQNWRKGITHYFWAYSPSSAGLSLDTSAPYSTASITNYVNDGSKDLIFAKARYDHPNQDVDNAHIDLTFHHAMSAVQFVVGNITDKSLQQNQRPDVEITRVSITANTKGDLETDGENVMTWTNQSTPGTISTGTDRGSLNSALSGNNALFMIPQFTSGAQVAVTFSDPLIGFPTTKTYDLPSGSWDAGKYYTYRISSKFSGKIMDDITPVMHPSGDVVLEDGVLKFSGGGTQGGYASFPGFDFSDVDKVQIEFDIVLGNDNSGYIYAKFGPQDSSINSSEFIAKNGTFLNNARTNMSRYNMFFVARPKTGTSANALLNPDSAGNSITSKTMNGESAFHVVCVFPLSSTSLTKEQLQNLSISFGYNGGNSSNNAKWHVSNLNVSIPTS